MSGRTLFTLRRIGVCGSSKELPKEALPFCQELGICLAKQEHIVIVSGGSRRKGDAAADDFAADWHIVQAAREYISQKPIIPSDGIAERIETVLTEDPGSSEWFQVGSTRTPRGKTREARRFSFVRSIDALIAVAGRGGTAQELALANELHTPVLPIPTFGGAARAFWDAYRSEMVHALQIDEQQAVAWEREPALDPQRLKQLAVEMVGALLESLPRRCFVIMPFHDDFSALYDFVIAPAVEAVGDQPVRVDRAAVPGDAVRQINDGIAASDYVVVVLDGLRANVLYELGLAHGRGKPTILLNRVGYLDSESVPFDIAAQQRIEYQSVDASLPGRLQKVIGELRMWRQ